MPNMRFAPRPAVDTDALLEARPFRRLVTRHEIYALLFDSFAKLACLRIELRRFGNRL